ncbi:hypothetical protein O3M35_006664 [Rhynocoris fuscipes]|uniref:Uncharacterized protein n=1 Tax=Rhynocoris fuscipes TaxID=488301 RepID=A0AAW1DF31_9HEMI
MPLTKPKNIRYKEFLEFYASQNSSDPKDSDTNIVETSDDEISKNDEEEELDDKTSSDESSSIISSNDDSNKESDKSMNEAENSENDKNSSANISRYNSEIKLSLNKLLELNDSSLYSILTDEESHCLKFVNLPSPILDSLLLQKLTHLDNDVAKQLIYKSLLDKEKNIDSNEEMDEQCLKKLINLKKSISICDDEEFKNLCSSEIYNILNARLTNNKKRAIDMFIHSLVQLNEKSKFYIGYNEILLMTEKNKKMRRKFTNRINKKSIKNDQKQQPRKQQKVIKKETKVIEEIDEDEENIENEVGDGEKSAITEDKEESSSLTEISELENIDIESDNDTTIYLSSSHESDEDNLENDVKLSQEDCNKAIEEFKLFIEESCNSGVQDIGKLVTSHISDTITKLQSQGKRKLQFREQSK